MSNDNVAIGSRRRAGQIVQTMEFLRAALFPLPAARHLHNGREAAANFSGPESGPGFLVQSQQEQLLAVLSSYEDMVVPDGRRAGAKPGNRRLPGDMGFLAPR